jgi:hypothetical protein
MAGSAIVAENPSLARDWMKRLARGAVLLLALQHGAMALPLCGCTGNAKRSRLLSSLRIELESPSSVEAGKHFPLTWSIHNMGSSAVDICDRSESIVLRDSQGNKTPLWSGMTFDGCSVLHLGRDERRDFAFSALVFPKVSSGPATISASIRMRIELGQWYRPGDFVSLSAEREVMVTRAEPSR